MLFLLVHDPAQFAMADSTPQLKRKRETADAQRKKAKTLQRNGGAGASLDES